MSASDSLLCFHYSTLLQQNVTTPRPQRDGFSAAGCAQLGQDRGDMEFHRVLADAQAPRNGFVRQALRHQLQHLALARRQGGVG